MPIQWKVDPADLLKKHGYSSYRIRQEAVFGQETYRSLRQRKPVSWDALGKICEITKRQPGSLIEYVREPKTSDRPDDVQSNIDKPDAVAEVLPLEESDSSL